MFRDQVKILHELNQLKLDPNYLKKQNEEMENLHNQLAISNQEKEIMKQKIK
jgi:hypothetical protein